MSLDEDEVESFREGLRDTMVQMDALLGYASSD
jgi:hypothetical protein